MMRTSPLLAASMSMHPCTPPNQVLQEATEDAIASSPARSGKTEAFLMPCSCTAKELHHAGDQLGQAPIAHPIGTIGGGALMRPKKKKGDAVEPPCTCGH